MTDLRIQIRAETHLVAENARPINAVRRFNVGYVVFSDHLDEGYQMWRLAPDRFRHWARKLGKALEVLAEAVQLGRNARAEVPGSLRRLADAFEKMGVVYGSHDDPNVESREMCRMIGARVAKFPLTGRVAAGATVMFSRIIMGAPHVETRGATPFMSCA